MDARFEDFGAMLAGVLRDFGVDARVGEVPGEYCPGAHSVNAHGTRKLIGTAQRMVKDAWLLSSIVQYDDAATLQPLLGDVYARPVERRVGKEVVSSSRSRGAPINET